jgi:hypothetical protein
VASKTGIKAGVWQCGFFKGCDQDCDCLVWNGAEKEACEAIIGFYGNQVGSHPAQAIHESPFAAARSPPASQCEAILYPMSL